MYKKILIVFILIFLTTGCWNYNELNSLAITTAMAIDKKDDKYEVSILIANSRNKQSSSENGESQTVVYSATGDTIADAMKNIDLENPRQTYIGHLAALIINEEVAKEGLVDVLDLLLRNSESTKRFFVAIARENKAKDILKIVSPLESFPAQTISTNIKTSSESQAVSVSVIYSDFIKTMLAKGIEPVLPTIKVEGDEEKGAKNSNLEQTDPKGQLKLDTVAIFDKDKLVGYATKDESRGINLALNKIDAMIIKYKCKKNYLVAEISGVTSKIDVKINNNIEPSIKIKASGDIVENNCDIDLTNPDVIDDVEKNVEKQIKNLVKKGIKYIQSEKVDSIGIGNLVYKQNPSNYKKIDDWNNYFSNLDIDIKVDANINSKGSIKKSLKEALDGN